MTDASPDHDQALLTIVGEVLTDHGPMTDQQLVAALSPRLPDLDGDVEAAVEQVLRALDAEGGPAEILADNRWAWLPALLAGRVFTHRISAAEATHDLVSVNPDLSAVTALLEFGGYTTLADGTPVTVVRNEFDPEPLEERDIPADLGAPTGLLLPAGYLDEQGISEGDTIAMRLTPSGLALTKQAEPAPTGPAPAGLARRLGIVLAAAEGDPVELDTAIWTACADEPRLFTEAVAPLTELIPGCGLVWEEEWLGSAGFDLASWRAGKRLGLLADRYQLSEDEAATVLATVNLYDQIVDVYSAAQTALDSGGESSLSAMAEEWGLETVQPSVPGAPARAGTGKRDTVRNAMALLAVPQVADAVLSEILGAGDVDASGGGNPDAAAAALGLFAETCEPLAPREARVALRWLRAKAHERLGDVARAEATYGDAQTLDADWPLNLLDLARYASDHGDAVRALSLLQRAGVPSDDPLVELLSRFQPTPRPELGRNQPCWCGSGRKYKACHSRRETFPLADRALWLYQKAAGFLDEESWWEDVVEVATERARYAEGPEGLDAAIHDPLVGDLVLFEGGAFEEFVAVRGELLPNDERSLAEQWLLVDRSLYEVCDVRPGDGLTVRDVRTGDVHEVRERTASRQLVAGAFVCARVVPAGDTMQIFGGLEPVALGERDGLIALLDGEPGPVELAWFLTRRYAPIQLSNTEGEPLVLCKATLRSDDPESLAAALESQIREPARDAREMSRLAARKTW